MALQIEKFSLWARSSFAIFIIQNNFNLVWTINCWGQSCVVNCNFIQEIGFKFWLLRWTDVQMKSSFMESFACWYPCGHVTKSLRIWICSIAVNKLITVRIVGHVRRKLPYKGLKWENVDRMPLRNSFHHKNCFDFFMIKTSHLVMAILHEDFFNMFFISTGPNKVCSSCLNCCAIDMHTWETYWEKTIRIIIKETSKNEKFQFQWMLFKKLSLCKVKLFHFLLIDVHNFEFWSSYC